MHGGECARDRRWRRRALRQLAFRCSYAELGRPRFGRGSVREGEAGLPGILGDDARQGSRHADLIYACGRDGELLTGKGELISRVARAEALAPVRFTLGCVLTRRVCGVFAVSAPGGATVCMRTVRQSSVGGHAVVHGTRGQHQRFAPEEGEDQCEERGAKATTKIGTHGSRKYGLRERTSNAASEDEVSPLSLGGPLAALWRALSPKRRWLNGERLARALAQPALRAT